MNSEKATAVSPSSSPRARGPSWLEYAQWLGEPLIPACVRPSVLDLLWSAAGVIAATSQARGVSHNQKTIKSRRKEKRRRRTNSLSLRGGRWCARAHADTLIDNRFYTVFSPVVRKSHTCSFKKEATSLPARRQLKTYNYNKGFPPDSSRLGKVFPLDGRHIRGDPDRP